MKQTITFSRADDKHSAASFKRLSSKLERFPLQVFSTPLRHSQWTMFWPHPEKTD